MAVAAAGWRLRPHSLASLTSVDRLHSDPVIVEVEVRAREFRPSMATIPVNREGLLVFENQDVEVLPVQRIPALDMLVLRR